MFKKISNFVNEKSLAFSVALFSSPAFADDNAEKYKSAIEEVDSEFDAGEVAVSAVMASTVEIYVIRRVWRIVRSSI